MANPTIDSKALGNVQSITQSKSANILTLPMPTGDSDETEAFDMLGVTQSIEVTGNWTGADTATVKALAKNILDIVDGTQESSVTFSSTETGDIDVKINDVQISWSVDGLSVRADYSIKMIEST